MIPRPKIDKGQTWADVGSQYRSLILTTSAEQSAIAQEKISEKQAEFSDPIVTEIRELDEFYDAEKYHQKYYDRNPTLPYCTLVIVPKLDKLREKFPHFIQ